MSGVAPTLPPMFTAQPIVDVKTGRLTPVGVNLFQQLFTAANLSYLFSPPPALGTIAAQNAEDLTIGRLFIRESYGAMGVIALTAGSALVTTTLVTANTVIFLTTQIPGGTAGALRIAARTPGTSFKIQSSSGADTGTVGWLMAEPATNPS